MYNTLNDNHATLLMLSFKDYRGVPIQGTHCIVAYRYENNIYFFDPQRKGFYEKLGQTEPLDGEPNSVLSMNLSDLVSDSNLQGAS